MGTFRSFEEIEAWKTARILVRTLYAYTNRGEFARDYALRDQVRRAAVSVMASIAEGFERNGNREFIQSLSIAKGPRDSSATAIASSFSFSRSPRVR